jgi:hypothetical protein
MLIQVYAPRQTPPPRLPDALPTQVRSRDWVFGHLDVGQSCEQLLASVLKGRRHFLSFTFFFFLFNGIGRLKAELKQSLWPMTRFSK